MRSFDDVSGSHWQAALMEASFGQVLMVFTRIGAEGVYRKLLDSANFGAAETLLAGAGADQLRDWLGAAEPWA